ncbi:Hemicentin 1 [Fasciola gigantica]|uniref:Hemicentin 1 n=1 Tax=Fasciola gigantica TaxID=46835 RepID=A0A504Y9A2_FASGI|nr:Hemicentin 1 [Fasciola gigantica]
MSLFFFSFTCVGTNKGGSTEIVYEVIALEKPAIEDFNEKAVVFVNNTITLTCEAIGSPPPKITWFFQGQPLNLNKTYGYRLVGPKNLMLLSASPYQGGEYTCLAENEAGSAKATTILTVFEPTSDRQMAQNLTIKTIEIGGNITFTCVMSSNPPAQIKWLKDEKDIFSVMPQDRFSISPDGSTLTLLSVKTEDQGEFKCLAINIPGSWNYRYTLEVTSSPGILRHSSSQSHIDVNRGQDLRLQCLATANPEPIYQWLKDETPLTMRVLALGDEVVDTRSVRANTTGISTRFSIHDNGRLLIVQNVQTEDAGEYTCVASNPVGEDRLHISVTVSSAPGFTDSLDHESPVMERGKSNALWCNATGYPEPKIRWEYELPPTGAGDRNLKLHHGNQQLYFPNVDYGVITRYTCVAKNKAGEIRRIFDPTLVYAPVITGSEGKNPRPVLQDASTRLTCDWEAAPRAKVEWFKDGELIDSIRFPRANISTSQTQLYLNNVQSADAGNYRCVVTNDYGRARRQWAVEVMCESKILLKMYPSFSLLFLMTLHPAPPSIRFSTPEAQDQLQFLWSPLRLALFCVASGQPPPKIKWTRDGKPIDTNRFTISEDQVHLRLMKVEENDGGRYACLVSSDYGQASRTFDVKITYAPRLESDGQLQYSLERTVGGSALLECLVSGNPRPKITWFKDGQPLQQLPYRQISYCCGSSLTEIPTAPARIDRGRVRTEHTIREGEELILPCPANGSPIPKIQFSRTGDAGAAGAGFMWTEQNMPRHAVVSQDRQTLTMFRTTKEDSGTYQCNASNAVGWDIMEYIVRVRVPPTFDTSNVQPEVHWFVNQTRSLDCTLTEGIDPPPQIKWERHGAPVVTGPDVQISLDGSKLTVPLVQPRDAGEYVCHAQNEVGKSTQVFNVLVYVRPRFIDSTRRTHVQAIQNETIQLACEATGEPRPRFAWFKRDVEILRQKVISPHFEGSQRSNIAILSGDQLLQISNIQLEDKGEYACTASNGGGTIEKKFNVTVIAAPRFPSEFVRFREKLVVRLGADVDFECPVLGSPPPTITWYYNGAPLTQFTSPSKYLFEEEVPPLVRLDKTEVREREGATFTVHCSAEGQPKPTLEWSREAGGLFRLGTSVDIA